MVPPSQAVKISAYILFAIVGMNLCVGCSLFGTFLIGTQAGSATPAQLINLASGSVLFFLVMVVHAVVAFYLLRLKSWARLVAMILAGLALLVVPIGTFMGIAVLYLLLQKQTQQAFV